MAWYYCLNNQRVGPVDEAAIKNLISVGTVNHNTLVWQDGMTSWQPAPSTALAALFAASGRPPISPADPSVRGPQSAPNPANPGTAAAAYTLPGRPLFGIRCPFCGYEGQPLVRKAMSAAGWVLFVVLLLFCIPLCWLPFVIDGCKDELRKCASCGSKIG
ncbi:MAG: LITAF-like zinc ribbon domain-containing protein [Thermoguttaceae bacterium]